MQSELKPCPFCGSKATLFKNERGYWGTCTNNDCDAETPGRVEPDEAASIWNRRAALSDKQAGEVKTEALGPSPSPHLEGQKYNCPCAHPSQCDDSCMPPAPEKHLEGEVVDWIGTVECPCTTFEQDETCPVGSPSLLCGACGGKGVVKAETVIALATEMLKVAEQVDELEDPFAAWETVDLLKSENERLKKINGEHCNAMNTYIGRVSALEDEIALLRRTLSPQTREKPRSALVDVPAVEPDYWTSHNNFENMLGKGVTDEKGGVVWDFALQTWVNADVPLYTGAPLREGEDSAEVIEALEAAREWIKILQGSTGNVVMPEGDERNPRDIGDRANRLIRSALAATRSASATSPKGCSE